MFPNRSNKFITDRLKN